MTADELLQPLTWDPASGRVAGSVARGEAVLLEPVGDGRRVAAYAAADLVEGQALGEPRFELLSLHGT